VIGSELKEFIRQRTIEEVKTHQSRRPAVSQINDSMLGLAQRAACKPRKTGTSAHIQVDPVVRRHSHNFPKAISHEVYKKAKYHIPNKLALRGCECTTASTSLSFPFPFPLLLEPPKDEGE
jgi:hypothetical protein